MPTYTQHTAHFNKAKMYTYNYSFIDDAIIETYNKGYTRQQIADALREPRNRIDYRIQVLLDENLIEYKRNTKKMRINRQIKMLERQIANMKAELATS